MRRSTRFWLELTCAGAGSLCAVGARVHVRAVPPSLSFARRPLAPLAKQPSCAQAAPAECSATYTEGEGPCFARLSVSGEQRVSSSWLNQPTAAE